MTENPSQEKTDQGKTETNQEVEEKRPPARAEGVISPWNVPNAMTALRMLLAVVLFFLMPYGYYGTSLVLFVVAAGTDWVDGWWARRYGQITVLGRILDPFADKLIVCGTFIYLAAEPALTGVPGGLAPWMVVVIVSREMLVTALRGLIEKQGGDFSAKMPGKLKMVFQCIAAAACLAYLMDPGFPENVTLSTYLAVGIHWTMIVALWASVVMTLYSGYLYIVAATRIISSFHRTP
jgi:CDP-diacylglycerol--glycerol-3-phosphate 3-phosphatidyltransferase